MYQERRSTVNCEFCDATSNIVPAGFFRSHDWWHVCPKCKSKILGHRGVYNWEVDETIRQLKDIVEGVPKCAEVTGKNKNTKQK